MRRAVDAQGQAGDDGHLPGQRLRKLAGVDLPLRRGIAAADDGERGRPARGLEPVAAAHEIQQQGRVFREQAGRIVLIAQRDDAARDGGILRPASFFARLHQPLPGGFNLGGQPGRLLEQRRSLGGRDDLPQGAGALRKHLLRQTKGGQQPAGRGIANARGERQAQPGGEFVRRHGGAKDGAAE